MNSLLFAALLLGVAQADVYLHTPRGSNNRNCRNDNNENRRNGNRLFDSQNNDKGGYSCPRSYPFDCYKYEQGSQERANCQNQNQDNKGPQAIISDPNDPNFGELKNPAAVRNERMYYYAGSILPLEWTAQHGCGSNPKVHCDMVVQVACEDTLTDSDGNTVRDGTPVVNNDGNNLNDEATTTIPDNNNNNVQADLRYGRHETLEYYQKCKNRERNKGLWIADQDVNNNQGATASRQNPNGNRNGLECPEESEYYPYFHASPWKDLVILTSNASKCPYYQAESQNVKPRNECVCTANACQGNSNLPNNEDACVAKGGDWVQVAAHNVPAPGCVAGAFSRDNHLGNAATPGSDPIMYNWTIPEWLGGMKRCVLRLRYNMTSSDVDEVPVVADFKLNENGNNPSPIVDREENEEASYKTIEGFEEQKLGFATNTNQYGRTFQDRTYTFEVKPRSAIQTNGRSCDGNLYNLNVRGKRGNIVQTYPSVEYDFVPNKLEITEDDCLHIQWTGSDYNPNRNPNNGEGGPPNPNNQNEGKSDRSNMVQQDINRNNFPVTSKSQFTMLDMTEAQWIKMTFNDQPIGVKTGPESCLTATELDNQGINNRQARERDNRNCAKLSGQKIPHMDVGVVKAGKAGFYTYMSTRNNNFSNRGQKGYISISEGTANKGGKVSAGAVVGIVAATIAVAGAAAFGGKMLIDKKGGSFSGLPMTAAGGAAAGAKPGFETKAIAASPAAGNTVIAKHQYDANEAGELSFKKGDVITVMRKDASGWWEGKTSSGSVGVFPSNYVA